MVESEGDATGVGAALLIDTLFALGVEDPLALSLPEQADAVNKAVADGRLDADRAEALRQLGALGK